MKLDHDCVRGVLLAVEELSGYTEHHLGVFKRLSSNDLMKSEFLSGYSQADVLYSVSKLDEAGYLNCSSFAMLGKTELIVSDLTFFGHEYLDSIKNDTVWKKVKTSMEKAGGSLAFEAIKTLGMKYLIDLIS